MTMNAPRWFGIGLAAGLFFLWCLVSSIETGLHGGWVWGLAISGIIGLVAFAMALIRFIGTRSERGDPLLRKRTANLRGGYGAALSGSGDVPRSVGEVPRKAAGRSIT